MGRSMQLNNTYRGPDTHAVAKGRFVACSTQRGWLKQASSNPQGRSREPSSAMPSKPLLALNKTFLYKSATHLRRFPTVLIEPALSL